MHVALTETLFFDHTGHCAARAPHVMAAFQATGGKIHHGRGSVYTRTPQAPMRLVASCVHVHPIHSPPSPVAATDCVHTDCSREMEVVQGVALAL